jgi:hypothetical protein
MNKELAKLRDDVSQNQSKLTYWNFNYSNANNFISKWYAKIKINKYQSKINKLNLKIDTIIGCC